MTQKLFNEDETYTQVACEVHKRASRFARELLKDYPEAYTRDVEKVVLDALGIEVVTARVTRALEKRKRARAAKEAPLERDR